MQEMGGRIDITYMTPFEIRNSGERRSFQHIQKDLANFHSCTNT